tara:strand:+ start:181 stop:624 length:444 start_codon:yes stop_codon:yes gene_type:complete
MNLIIRKIDEQEDFLKIFKLRIEVFIFEQKCPIEEEFDIHDNLNSDSIHFIVEDNDECIGTARIVKYENNKFKIQRVCIKKSKRKLNFGSKLMDKMHQYLIDLNVSMVEISAQISAIKFYKNLGYFEEGSLYLEAGLEHIKMAKKLS